MLLCLCYKVCMHIHTYMCIHSYTWIHACDSDPYINMHVWQSYCHSVLFSYNTMQLSSEVVLAASRIPQEKPVYYVLYVTAAVIVMCWIALPLYGQVMLYSIANVWLRHVPMHGQAKFSIATSVASAYCCMLHQDNVLIWKTFLHSRMWQCRVPLGCDSAGFLRMIVHSSKLSPFVIFLPTWRPPRFNYGLKTNK